MAVIFIYNRGINARLKRSIASRSIRAGSSIVLISVIGSKVTLPVLLPLFTSLPPPFGASGEEVAKIRSSETVEEGIVNNSVAISASNPYFTVLNCQYCSGAKFRPFNVIGSAPPVATASGDGDV